MATQKPAKKATQATEKIEKSSGTPKFPYTILPAVLKKLLKEIPKRPRPPKMTRETLKVWGVSASGNSDSAIRVLKKIGLLDESGQPKAEYALFMDPAKGPQVLGGLLGTTYKTLFETSLRPLDSSTEELKTFFNVHSGGAKTQCAFKSRLSRLSLNLRLYLQRTQALKMVTQTSVVRQGAMAITRCRLFGLISISTCPKINLRANMNR